MLVTAAMGAFVSEYRNSSVNASHCGQSGDECRDESEPLADAVGICQ